MMWAGRVAGHCSKPKIKNEFLLSFLGVFNVVDFFVGFTFASIGTSTPGPTPSQRGLRRWPRPSRPAEQVASSDVDDHCNPFKNKSMWQVKKVLKQKIKLKKGFASNNDLPDLTTPDDEKGAVDEKYFVGWERGRF